MAPLMAFTVIDLVADVLACTAVVALAAAGFQYGLFLAVVTSLIVFTAFVTSLALAPGLATHLELVGLPAAFLLPAAYFAILLATCGVARVAVGGAVVDRDVRFPRLVDRVGGLVAGAFAGMLLGGALLVGWSMCEMPAGSRLNAPATKMDLGARLVWSFVRLLVSDENARLHLFSGDPIHPGGAGVVLRASEPFDDADGDWMWDENELYLDFDHNKEFTIDQLVTDLPQGKPGSRDIGLSDRYWLSAWRAIRVLHRPQIAPLVPNSPVPLAQAGAVIFRAVAADPDPQDKLRYSLQAGRDDDEPLLQIDPETGEVRFCNQPIDPTLKKVKFVVVVTDRSELSDSQKVTIPLQPPAEEVAAEGGLPPNPGP